MSTAGAQPANHVAIFADGFRLHYVEAGEGEPVVLLHGFPQTCYAWRKVMPGLAERFRVIAPDLRGCGDTDRPPDGYDKQTVAADIRRLVEHLGLNTIRLVGHDVGMMVGYAYACAHRGTVSQLVMMEAALPGLGLEELYDAVAFPRMYHLPLFEAPNQLAEMLIAGREAVFVDHFIRQQTYDPTGIEDAALDEYARRLAQPGCLHAGISYFRVHRQDAGYNQEQAKTKLAMPVLSVAGAASAGDHLERQLRQFANDLTPIVIDRCGHYIAEERPDVLLRVLHDFFAGHPPAKTIYERSGEPGYAKDPNS